VKDNCCIVVSCWGSVSLSKVDIVEILDKRTLRALVITEHDELEDEQEEEEEQEEEDEEEAEAEGYEALAFAFNC